MKEYLNKPVNLFDAKAESASSAAINVKDFDNLALEVITAGFSGTYKFAGSNADVKPDFASAASASNPWSYLSFEEMIARGTVVAGGTGISETTQSTVRNFLIPTPVLKWFGVVMTRSAGTVTMNLQGASSEN